MQQLDTFTDAANQLFNVPLADASILQLAFIFRGATQRWTVDIVHPQLTLHGFDLCLGPNIVRQWRNVVPFGIALTSVDDLDPVQPQDFQTGRVSVFILSPAEVQQVETDILAPIPLVNP